MNTYTQILRKYETAFRDAIRNRDQEAGQSLAQALEPIDWSFICTALDVIGDTTCAIQHFLETGIEVRGNKTDEGEKYLRLYGVLNSTYLQQEAINVLYQKLVPSDGKDAIKLINELRIRDLRNKVGSHSSNYKPKKSKGMKESKESKESYVVIRNTLSKFSFEFINNHSHEREWVNIKECLEENLKLIVDLLDKVYEESIKTLHKGENSKLQEHMQRLSELRMLQIV